jgi:hypothetical protein
MNFLHGQFDSPGELIRHLLHCRKDLSIETLPSQVNAEKKADSDDKKSMLTWSSINIGGNVNH